MKSRPDPTNAWTVHPIQNHTINRLPYKGAQQERLILMPAQRLFRFFLPYSGGGHTTIRLPWRGGEQKHQYSRRLKFLLDFSYPINGMSQQIPSPRRCHRLPKNLSDNNTHYNILLSDKIHTEYIVNRFSSREWPSNSPPSPSPPWPLLRSRHPTKRV